MCCSTKIQTFSQTKHSPVKYHQLLLHSEGHSLILQDFIVPHHMTSEAAYSGRSPAPVTIFRAARGRSARHGVMVTWNTTCGHVGFERHWCVHMWILWRRMVREAVGANG